MEYIRCGCSAPINPVVFCLSPSVCETHQFEGSLQVNTKYHIFLQEDLPVKKTWLIAKQMMQKCIPRKIFFFGPLHPLSFRNCHSELVLSDTACSPEFIQELLPSVERTALLYHLSYLSLGSFPKLERLIRKRAMETQLLFGSSEAVLLKCVGTSDNLVKSLLPFLKVAVEKNKPQLALKFLDKAKEWIGEIIRDVKEIVQRYEKHNSDVAKSNSDIITEKEETEKKQQQQTCEMETLQKNIEDLDANLHNINKEIEDHEKKIEQKNVEIKKFINSITNTKNQQLMQMPAVKVTSVAIFLMMVPFVEHIMNYICKMETSQESMIRTLQTGLSELTSAKQHLKEQEWDIQNKLMDKQLQKTIPCVSHLDEVQICLSQIQQILVQLQKFWEKVGSLLDTLKQRTFAGEDWIDELTDLKEQFLESIDAAKEGWTQFGISCMKANKIFSDQSSQAYKFLEVSPSSLSKEQWEKEYESVKEKLEKIRLNTVNHKAIMQ
ncbi:uncharacterized protein LOC127161829 [Labeo rohita]|uniref:uncharacterized protein LOC127161829 n=1 Tax=Labeo rohita TaxID=84645 RepID=UPI0021E1CC13|nr:uncharacterized protein LOC127161829 [Labeo rohita]